MSATERSFGEIHFGAAKLGNLARTKRLVRIADSFTRQPQGSLPHKFQEPAALQAAYRLMDRKEVTHASVMAAHYAETQRRIAAHDGPLLAVCDSTELDYSGLKSLPELGRIGKGTHRGYVCHNVLIVDPTSREALGLAQQILHTRAEVPKGESKEASRARQSRESRLWPLGTCTLPKSSQLIVVCDRGGDTFEELEHESRSQRSYVIRSKSDRKVFADHDGERPRSDLHALAQGATTHGQFSVDVAATPTQPARKATVSYSSCALRIIPPKQPRGEHSQDPLALWVVRVWEPNPPPGAPPLEWLLLTNLPVTSAKAARRVINHYECRWTVEEFHKSQKTGCEIENLQFTKQSRLEPMIGLLSVVALSLLNLRDASRKPDAQTKPAREIVSQEYVDTLSLWRHGERRSDWTVAEFFLALARLGGHQNRRHDKPPGWIVLWRGWSSLQLLVNGARLARGRKKLG